MIHRQPAGPRDTDAHHRIGRIHRVLIAASWVLIAGCRAHAGGDPIPLVDSGITQLRVPADGFVPTADIAVTIARAVLIPVYGQRQIERQLPLTAELRDGVWVVQGTLPSGARGGVARLELSQRDARILHLSHGR
jgi:hypothetical protein